MDESVVDDGAADLLVELVQCLHLVHRDCRRSQADTIWDRWKRRSWTGVGRPSGPVLTAAGLVGEDGELTEGEAATGAAARAGGEGSGQQPRRALLEALRRREHDRVHQGEHRNQRRARELPQRQRAPRILPNPQFRRRGRKQIRTSTRPTRGENRRPRWNAAAASRGGRATTTYERVGGAGGVHRPCRRRRTIEWRGPASSAYVLAARGGAVGAVMPSKWGIAGLAGLGCPWNCCGWIKFGQMREWVRYDLPLGVIQSIIHRSTVATRPRCKMIGSPVLIWLVGLRMTFDSLHTWSRTIPTHHLTWYLWLNYITM